MLILGLTAVLLLGIFDFLAGQGSSKPPRGERLGRGIVARRRPDGRVFLSWRLLADDPDRTFFRVYRRPAGADDDSWVPLTAVPIRHGTNYLDETAREAEACDYQLQPLLGGVEGPFEGEIQVPARPGKPYLSLPLEGEGEALSVVAGDLDGDGEYELVVRRGGALEAYRLDGTMLWRREALDAATPYTVFDLDGDGQAEVHTGEPGCTALHVAYLEGGEPQLISQGPGIAADVDGDGLDEIVLGSVALDHDGTVLWSHDLGPMSVLHVAHILAGREGLQVFYALRNAVETGGLGLLDAATGEPIWSLDLPTTGFLGPGLVADLLADQAGMQLFAAERDGRGRLFAADGRQIATDLAWPPDMMAAYWDGMAQKALVDPRGRRVFRYPDEELVRLDDGARVLAVLDLLGDWREEIIAAVPGELRIYTTDIPSPERRVTLMQDRMYRTGAARMGMAQASPPQESGEVLKPPGPLFGW